MSLLAHQNEQEMADLRRANAELERRVAELSESLEQSSQALLSLSHSISHDLRAPLRTIMGFSKIVLSADTGNLAPETIDSLGRITAGAERMGALIDDLLMLSRISRQQLRRGAVNFSQLAADVAFKLQQAHPSRLIECLIAPGMTVNADPALSRIILENLLDNAWKFTSRTDSAKVEVMQLQPDGEIMVRDNGAGFDMRYAEKLFAPFQRLHTTREFDGNGIGLSIVQCIVIKHGGKVSAEAKPKEGATFRFTLEKSTPSPDM